jgi:hypothetical protein
MMMTKVPMSNHIGCQHTSHCCVSNPQHSNSSGSSSSTTHLLLCQYPDGHAAAAADIRIDAEEVFVPPYTILLHPHDKSRQPLRSIAICSFLFSSWRHSKA